MARNREVTESYRRDRKFHQQMNEETSENVSRPARSKRVSVAAREKGKAGRGTANGSDDGGNASKGKKRGPKTDPKAPHNAKIRSEADALEADGNTIVAGGGRRPERLVPTPGGAKSGRRPDIIYETPEGSTQGRNIGRTRADGTPVKREVEALDDLNGPGGLPTDFVPYDR
jgi:hypothetical protein